MTVVNEQAVVVGLSGGLGNQMFQYAAGRSLAARFGVPLALDLSWFGGRSDRRFALHPFKIKALERYQFPWLMPRGQALLSRFSRRWLPRLMGVTVWREPHFHYSSDFASLSKPVYLEGYWQSYRYFQEIRPLLMQEFALREALPSACTLLLAEINDSDSICVHFRRGDYLSNPVAASYHGICQIDYYLAGIRELCQGLLRPRVFVFSDDPGWVRSSFFVDCPMTLVDSNGPDDAHLDLLLMAACRHFVIANSSLSWWGAWLSSHAGKKVIAPSRWFQNADHDTRDLLPPTWKRC